MKKAFTLIELIFSIVILGFIGGNSISMIGEVYINYGHQQEINRLEQKSIQLLTQISKYLSRSLPNSLVKYEGGQNTTDSINMDKYKAIETINDGDLSTGEMLLWIDKDKESISPEELTPYYNKWINLDTTNDKEIYSVDNNFTGVSNISAKLLYKASSSTTESFFFINSNDSGTPAERFYDNPPTSLFEIDSYDNSDETHLTLKNKPEELSEFFYITNTGKGLKLVGDKLFLIQDYQPWELNGSNQETFLDGQSYLLSDKVKSVKYHYESNMLRINVCITSNYVIDEQAGNLIYANICKETILEVN